MSLSQFHVPPQIKYTHEDGTEDVFVLHEELGHGGFSYVYRATLQHSNKTYAIKVISKEFAYSKGKLTQKKLKNEMKIQKGLYHPNIVRSKMSFSDELNYYIVLELCPGRSVREYLKKSENGFLSEPETRKILRDVLLGLIFLHSNNIVHHDLKLENFVIGNKGKVKITDFGLSALLKNEDEKQRLTGGTTNYMSPEIIQNEEHSFGVDIWAIGVCAFIMLIGQPPFEGSSKEVVYEKIKNCDYHFPIKNNISNEAKNFIKSTLRHNQQKRPTAYELYNHPFLTKIDQEQVQLYNPIQSVQKTSLSSPRAMHSNPNQSIQKVHTLQKFRTNLAFPASLNCKHMNLIEPNKIQQKARPSSSNLKKLKSNDLEDPQKKEDLNHIYIPEFHKISPFC